MAEVKVTSLSAPLALLALLATGCGSGMPTESVGGVAQAIQGGYVDDETRGVVGLGMFEVNHFYVGHCSGTLIAPNLVLTARHCVTQLPLGESETEVECGQTDFRTTGDASSLIVSPETDRPDTPLDPSFVAGLSVHPVPGANDVCGYDIALIILERPLTADEAQPIVPRIDQQSEPSEPFSAEGFGLTSDAEDATSGRRMRIDGNEVLCATEQCHVEFPELVNEGEWVSADAGVCSGDSGGPALDGEGRVMGVASRGGDECRATIYGDVAYWGDFIIETALEAARLGDYPAPFWTSGSSEATDGASAATDNDGPNGGEAPVVLDEPGNSPEASEADDSDFECGSAQCDKPRERNIAAEGGCAVRGRTTWYGLVWAAALALLALGRRRRV